MEKTGASFPFMGVFPSDKSHLHFGWANAFTLGVSLVYIFTVFVYQC